MTKYNKTQLNPDTAFEKHVFHRDMFAHYLRWTYVLKISKIGMNILDLGCGSGNLAEVLYRNRYKANKYLGLDIRKQIINKNIEKFEKVKWVEFKEADLCDNIDVGTDWNIIACFELIEHIGKDNAEKLLTNIQKCMNGHTVLLLSTPNYDRRVGAAKNHMIDGEIGEFTYAELYNLLDKHFKIEQRWGTFVSQRDYKNKLDGTVEGHIFNKLNEYYDTNILSNLMAPLFPMESRNILWRLKLK